MNEQIQTMLQDSKVKGAILGVLGMLTIFLIVQTITSLSELRFVGAGVPATNTITVDGTGEAFAIPDIATVYFTVMFEESTVNAAQEKATERTNAAIAYLKEEGVEEKDIRTESYNVYPQYDYITTTCIPGVPCRGGEQQLRGYQVSQTVAVKVRSVENVGTILGGLGELNVQNISGPNFEIDDIDSIRAEAREQAVEEARAKAKALAKDLNVRLVRVVGFWEDTNPYGYPMYAESYDMALGKGGMNAPEIPTGESKVTSRVNITYEIR